MYLMQEKQYHVPVLAHEVEQYLNLSEGDCFVDCTTGLGGHAALLAKHLGETGTMIAIDRDKEALEMAKENLQSFSGRIYFVQDDFRNINRILDSLNIHQVDGMLFDLGVSSYQLDSPMRGFSIQEDGPLDMRMNRDDGISAYDLINTLSENEISFILKNYGEERFHHRIARFIVHRRREEPIKTTTELKELVVRAMPVAYRHQKIHPATRTFQAFRIMVNRELESLEMALDKCMDYLKPQARIGVISFHSLEDRIVKNKFRLFAAEKKLTLIVKKPIQPLDIERIENSRSRSARLRVGEKI